MGIPFFIKAPGRSAGAFCVQNAPSCLQGCKKQGNFKEDTCDCHNYQILIEMFGEYTEDILLAFS